MSYTTNIDNNSNNYQQNFGNPTIIFDLNDETKSFQLNEEYIKQILLNPKFLNKKVTKN